MNFSEKIKTYRKQNNLTQEQLADRLAISRQAVSKWEQGRGYPDIKTLEALSKLLGISIDLLLSSEETTTLSLNSAQKINSTVKGLFVTVCCLALVLILTLTFVLAYFFSKSNLEGLVGFYIDVDSSDGAFDLKNPNSVDIYYFKNLNQDQNHFDDYVKNGIVDHSLELTQHTNLTSFARHTTWVYVDATAKGFVIYQVYEKNGGYKTVKHGEITQMPLSGDIRDTAVLSYSFYDRAVKNGREVGCSFDLYYTYKHTLKTVKIVEYSDMDFKTEHKQQILTEFKAEGYYYLDLENTKSFEVYGISGDDQNLYEALLTAKSGVPNSYLGEFYVANSYGYIPYLSTLFVTYAKPMPF